MHIHILHCDETVGVHDILCMQTTFIVAGICVALSNFSSVLLPCLCTSKHKQHASNYTKATTHKFSLVGCRARTQVHSNLLNRCTTRFFLLSFSPTLPSSQSMGFRAFVFPLLNFCFLEYIFSSNVLFSNNCKENRSSCSPFRLSNHSF